MKVYEFHEEDCIHENIDCDHCEDCGLTGEEIVCRSCKEWTIDINPCCG